MRMHSDYCFISNGDDGRWPSIYKCAACGRFISFAEMDSGNARFEFEPLNEFGLETAEWICAKCVGKENTK